MRRIFCYSNVVLVGNLRMETIIGMDTKQYTKNRSRQKEKHLKMVSEVSF